ncbi:class II fructose-bisphosphate aldolase [Nocardioides mangrovicus]|uniref:Class II fructose-bisphosphate aldolase n=1 Tax=Nocardioides mangrovicus TaxID=2478913 RepID=A0A3L8P7M6_9ACTN|nr:class II fructose-bisphosphate aldolase [Nocardioides mangrovicus]RLV50942.1 class II fructose-bisphosphate aldolase [Nocardioides mangrovicus]
MAQVDPKGLVEAAAAGGYAVGAFNMHNPETTEALLLGAEQAASPVFLQVGRALVPHVGLRKAYEMTRRIAEESEAEYVIHLDHGPWDEVFEAIRLGFTSIMYDGAHLPFEENIATTRHVVEVAHSFGIPVEAELGRIPDADQPVDDWTAYYTDVAEAERFVAETGVDLLAVSVGIVHGVPLADPQPLDIQRIKEIKAVTGVPLVLHGASGVPDAEITAAIDAGVHKFNADTDLRHAFRAGIEDVWKQGDRQLEEAMAEGRRRMVAATVGKMRVYGCAGTAGGAA